MAVTGRAGAALPRVVDRLGLASGISNGYVLDILHDDKGYTWIATEDGLNRSDMSSAYSRPPTACRATSSIQSAWMPGTAACG